MNLLNFILGVNIFGHFSQALIEIVIYAIIGIVISIVSYFVVDMIIPGNMGKQIAKEKNVPIAIVAGSMILGIGIIIAAAVLK